MRKEMYRLLIYSNVSNVVFTFVNLFVNLYIWQQHKSIADLTWFNASIYSFWSISYLMGSMLFYKTSLPTVMKVSSVLSVLLFFLLSFCRFQDPLHWIIFSGGIFGLMKGVYSSGYTQAISIIGNNEEYTLYFQQSEVWNSIVNIIMPLLFGLLLLVFTYKTMFIVMLFFSFVMLFLSNSLPVIKPKDFFGNIKLFDNFSPFKVFKNKDHRLLPLSYLSGGVFSQFQSTFLLFFTFTITSDKMWVAVLNVLYTLLSLLSIRLYKKVSLKDETWLFIGISIAFVGLFLTIFLEKWWMIIPNVLLVFGNFYYRTTYFSQHFQAISNEGFVLKYQVTIWREIMLCISRVTLLSLILIFNKFVDVSQFIYWLMAFALLSALSVPFIHRSFGIEKREI